MLERRPFLGSSSSLLIAILCFSLFWGEGETCTRILVSSENFGKLDFVLDGGVSRSNRPIYREVFKRDEKESTRWLYHAILDPVEEGIGRWFIGHELESTSGVAFIDSWAVVPHALEELSPLAKWKSYSWGAWREENDVKVECLDEYDRTLFLCSELNKGVCGFYFPISIPDGFGEDDDEDKKNAATPVFHSTNGKKFYRVPDGSRWMVSDDEVGSSSGIAFIDCKVRNPDDISLICPKRKWNVVSREGDWKKDKGFVFLGGGRLRNEDSVFSRRRTLNNPELMDRTQLATLSNGVSLPLVGLGTGGLDREETRSIVTTAITEHGYGLIDTASQYNNEDVVGDVLEEMGSDVRSQMAVSSKVWPTRLGFYPTIHTIEEGLDRIKSGYFDVYLLHWPFCYDHIEWMNCPPTPSGTWQQSWRALEKAYSEGIIRAIGVSNFDGRLLGELVGLASVPPHLVQNWMDPLHVDQGVFSICKTHNTMFQAYSLVREWVGRGSSGDRAAKQTIRKQATENRVTISELLLRWALQFGPERAGVSLGVVVRSKTRAHLGANVAVVKKEPLSFNTMRVLSSLQFSQFRKEL